MQDELSALPAPPQVAASAPPPQPPPARVWPSLVVMLAVFPLSTLVSITFILVALLAIDVEPQLDDGSFYSQLIELGKSPWGLLALVVPGELVYLACALGPAALSPVPLLRRIGLARPRIGFATGLLVLLGTLGVQQATLLVLMPLLGEPSEQMRWISTLLTQPEGGLALLTLLLFSVLPGICEELFFRGYLQTRLSERWPAWAAIGLASVVFAAVHGDVQHSLAVLPLGVWFGFVGWKCGSVLVPIACHVLNNFTAILFAWWIADPDLEQVPLTPTLLGALLVLCTCTLCAALALLRGPDRAQSPASGTA
jgi:membrane protease YdiL (CAAX protease family)